MLAFLCFLNASVLFLCTDSLSSCLIFVSSVWASLPEIKTMEWNGLAGVWTVVGG